MLEDRLRFKKELFQKILNGCKGGRGRTAFLLLPRLSPSSMTSVEEFAKQEWDTLEERVDIVSSDARGKGKCPSFSFNWTDEQLPVTCSALSVSHTMWDL